MENSNQQQQNQQISEEQVTEQKQQQVVEQQQVQEQQQLQQNHNDSWVDEEAQAQDGSGGGVKEDNKQNEDDDEIYLDEDEMNDLNAQLDEMDNELDNVQQIAEEDDQEAGEENNEEDEEEKFKETTKNQDQSIKQFQFHTSFGCCIKVNQNNPKMFFTGGGDDLATIWNLEKDEKNPMFVLKGHTDSVDSISLNFDNTLLATSSLDSTVKIWNINTGELKFNLEGPSQEIRFIDWHNKGNAIIAGSSDNSIYMWNGNNGQYMQSFYGHEKALTAGQFSPNGKFIVSVSEDASLRVWNPKTAENIHKISGANNNQFHQSSINCLGIHNTSQVAVTGCYEGFVCLSNINNGKILGKTKDLKNGIEKICISEKHDCIFAGTLDGTIFKMDFNKLIEKGKFQCDDSISQLHIIDDNHLIMCSTFNGTIYVFDHRQDQKITVLTNPQTIHDFSWDLQNQLIYAICEDGRVRVFNYN